MIYYFSNLSNTHSLSFSSLNPTIPKDFEKCSSENILYSSEGKLE
jgi:hypothetical protein